jgi:hypothetical protein
MLDMPVSRVSYIRINKLEKRPLHDIVLKVLVGGFWSMLSLLSVRRVQNSINSLWLAWKRPLMALSKVEVDSEGF